MDILEHGGHAAIDSITDIIWPDLTGGSDDQQRRAQGETRQDRGAVPWRVSSPGERAAAGAAMEQL